MLNCSTWTSIIIFGLTSYLFFIERPYIIICFSFFTERALCLFNARFIKSSNTYSIVYWMKWLCCFTEEFLFQIWGAGECWWPKDWLQEARGGEQILMRPSNINLWSSPVNRGLFQQHRRRPTPEPCLTVCSGLEFSNLSDTQAKPAGWIMQESLEQTGFMLDRWLCWEILRFLSTSWLL